jgi:hypothetical protein
MFGSLDGGERISFAFLTCRFLGKKYISVSALQSIYLAAGATHRIVSSANNTVCMVYSLLE